MDENRTDDRKYGEGSIITDLDQITPSWLTDILRKDVEFQHIEVSKIRTATLPTLVSQLIYLRVTYIGGTDANAPKKLILKINDANGSESLYTEMGKKEVIFYNTFAYRINPSVLVPCYDAVYDSKTNRFHILMADLSDTHFQTEWPLPPLKRHCELVIDSIADVHAACWDNQELFGIVDPQFFQSDSNQLEAQHQVFKTYLAEVVGEFLDFIGDRISNVRRDIYKLVLSGFFRAAIQRRLAGSGFTLAHGDGHFWNVLMPHDTNADTVRMIDWATYEVNLSSKDLAYMMALHWYPERRKCMELELLKRYHERLIANGVSGYDWHSFWYDYRLCVIANMFIPPMQWKNKIPARVWWSHLERSMLSFEDLACAELLQD